jgi:hypothetical protein
VKVWKIVLLSLVLVFVVAPIVGGLTRVRLKWQEDVLGTVCGRTILAVGLRGR